jgi:hypothetical protein
MICYHAAREAAGQPHVNLKQDVAILSMLQRASRTCPFAVRTDLRYAFSINEALKTPVVIAVYANAHILPPRCVQHLIPHRRLRRDCRAK